MLGGAGMEACREARMLAMGADGVLGSLALEGRVEVEAVEVEWRGRRERRRLAGTAGSETAMVSEDVLRPVSELCGVVAVDEKSMMDRNPIGVAEGVLWPRP